MELSPSPTDINRTKCTRTVPMRCLVLGLGRTGTKSVCTALTILGLDHVYHMDSALNNPPDNGLWLRALATKYPGHPLTRGYERGFGKEEWDQLLGHCQAVTDFPAVIFARELIDAYPEAKVILTNRNVDSWYESILHTIDWRYHDPGLYLTSLLSPTASKYASMFYCMWSCLFHGDFKPHGKQVFLEHYESVRALIPPERLLEYEAKEGWGPLCEFLDIKVPDTPFPMGNDAGDFKTVVRKLDWMRVREVVRSKGMVVLGVVVAAVGIWLAGFIPTVSTV